jgi:hypothetical protein
MRRRVLSGLVAAALTAALLPGVGTAGDPSGDHVTGAGLWGSSDPGYLVWVSAHGDGDGSEPRGRVVLQNLLTGYKVTAEVVCLHVRGNRAAVGAVIVKSSWPVPYYAVGKEIAEYIVDDGTVGTGSDRSFTSHGEPAEECSVAMIPYIPAAWWATVEEGNYVVKDGD